MKNPVLSDLFIKVPKQLMIAIANKVDAAKPTMILGYLVVVDRFSNKEGHGKVCFDNNDKICRRTGLSKHCVDRALHWLIKHGFLVARYPVKISDSKGSREVFYKTSGAAFGAQKNYLSSGTTASLATRKLSPPSSLPNTEMLGLTLIDKNNGIYSSEPIKKATNTAKEDFGPIEFPIDQLKIDQTDIQNGGTKLDPLSEITLNADSSNENDSNETEERINNNNPYFENPEATLGYDLTEIDGDSTSAHLDHKFVLAVIVLKTLALEGFPGAALRTLRRSAISPFVSKITGDHFIYVLRRCGEHGDVPDWILNLALEYEHEFEGIGSELQKLH